MAVTEYGSKKYRRSVSQVKLMRKCPEQFRLLKIVGEEYVPSVAAIQGSAFHSTYQAWEISGRQIDPELVFGLEFDMMMENESSKTPLSRWKVWGRGRTIDEDINIRRDTGSNQIFTYTQRCLNDPWIPMVMNGLPAVEVPFQVDIGKTNVVGSVDTIVEYKGDMKVRDLKTGGREASAFQLGLYAVALQLQYGLRIVHGDFYYAKDDTTSKPYDLRNFTVDYLSTQLEALETIIQNNAFLASPSSDCFNCPVMKKCREFQ